MIVAVEHPALSKQIKRKTNTCKIGNNTPSSNPYLVEVEFISNLSMEEIVLAVKHLSSPHVIIWYIGCYGVSKAGIQFYRDSLISPILKDSEDATLWLVDLTAWGAFKNPYCSIDSHSRICEIIENMSHKQIKCIKSSKIFKKMQEINDKDILSYFRKALRRNFIFESSKYFQNNNIRTGDIFSGQCPVASNLYEYDASKSYSIFQYLEGCLLVDEIFVQQITNNLNDIQIVFALPNDEIKYYKDKQKSFQKDIKYLITKRCAIHDIKNIRLRVKFLAFNYGSKLQDRPYNAPGKVLRNETLSREDILGKLKKDEKISMSEAIYEFNPG